MAAKTLPEYTTGTSVNGRAAKPARVVPGMVVGNGKIRIVVEKIEERKPFADKPAHVVFVGTQFVMPGRGLLRKEGKAEVNADQVHVTGRLSDAAYARLGLKGPAK
jgi:hypothetical protein